MSEQFVWALTSVAGAVLVALCALSLIFGLHTEGTAVVAVVALFALFPGLSRLVDAGLDKWWPR